MRATQIDREGFRDGVVALHPAACSRSSPFGLVLGVTAAASGHVGGALGIATSPIIFAGAAQLVTVQLFGTDTTWR